MGWQPVMHVGSWPIEVLTQEESRVAHAAHLLPQLALSLHTTHEQKHSTLRDDESAPHTPVQVVEPCTGCVVDQP